MLRVCKEIALPTAPLRCLLSVQIMSGHSVIFIAWEGNDNKPITIQSLLWSYNVKMKQCTSVFLCGYWCSRLYTKTKAKLFFSSSSLFSEVFEQLLRQSPEKRTKLKYSIQLQSADLNYSIPKCWLILYKNSVVPDLI